MVSRPLVLHIALTTPFAMSRSQYMQSLSIALVAGGVLLTASLDAAAGTPNTTAAGAVSYEVGQGWVTHAIDEAAQDRWFTFREVAGRS